MTTTTAGPLRVGVDIGGTFTDVVLMGSDGLRAWTKVSSTTADYSLGIIQGLESLLTRDGPAAPSLSEIVHATTVATNAILEGRGARTGLITTAGFRDVLEIRRLRMARLYDLRWQPPPPLVPRSLRVEVDERLDAEGQVIRPLDEASARAAIARLVDADVKTVAVVLLHSYRNPQHEERVGELLRELAPHITVSLSSRILAEIGEYERTSTTAINAFIAPVIRTYLTTLQQALEQRGLAAPVFMMQSAGGMMTAAQAAERPVHVIESGPAAGVMGAASLAATMQVPNVITLDMGGTTAKASVIEDGRITRTHDYEVGGGISLSARLQSGGGYALRAPAVDLAEVGAGGGSIAWIDPAGALRVGPQSAGAEPGPACYDLGGEAPTLTDANVALGYLHPTYLLGGTLPIKADLAQQSIADQVAGPLGISLPEAAHGIYRLAVSHMSRAVRAVTVERGRTPADFTLFAFGGSGPLLGADMARELGIRQVVIPPFPGLFSSLGLLCVDMTQHDVRTVLLPLSEVSAGQLADHFAQLQERLMTDLADSEAAQKMARIHQSADVRYKGQSFALSIPVDDLNPDVISAAFAEEHERTYGHRAEHDPVELVNVRVEVAVPRATTLRWGQSTHAAAQSDSATQRSAYFGIDDGERTVPVVARSDLTAQAQAGPLIVEEYDTTIVVPPGCTVRLDTRQNVVLEVGPAA
ncbi:MAG: hydantoinase [Dehalococcoidia bacterium]|nr:hydantoinase [Dehalococcoidia bacterium]